MRRVYRRWLDLLMRSVAAVGLVLWETLNPHDIGISRCFAVSILICLFCFGLYKLLCYLLDLRADHRPWPHALDRVR